MKGIFSTVADSYSLKLSKLGSPQT